MERGQKVALYARVSTGEQTAENQIAALREYARAQGFEIFGEFVDVQSGAEVFRDRDSEHSKLLDLALRIRPPFRAILVWKIDRFARSVSHLSRTLEDLERAGVEFLAVTQNIDTSRPEGKLVFHILSAVAEFERKIIADRVKAGLERAKRKGTRSGRPIGRPRKATVEAWEKALKLRELGWSYERIGRKLGISTGLACELCLRGPGWAKDLEEEKS